MAGTDCSQLGTPAVHQVVVEESRTNLLTLNLETKGVDYPAVIYMVDSGAEISVIKKSYVGNNELDDTNRLVITGVGEDSIKSLGRVKLALKFGQEWILHSFVVVEDRFNIEPDAILGLDFILDKGVILNGSTKEFQIGDVRMMMRVQNKEQDKESGVLKVESRVKLLANSARVLKIMVRGPEEGLIEKRELAPGVIWGSTLVRQKDGFARVTVLNVNEEDTEIPYPEAEIEGFEEYIEDHERFIDGEERLKGLKRLEKLRENLRLSHLRERERKDILDLLEKYNDVFYLEGDELGYCPKYEHCINLEEGTTPIYVRPYRFPFQQRNEMDSQVQKMLKNVVIEGSDSPWNFPVLLVKKKADASGRRNGGW